MSHVATERYAAGRLVPVLSVNEAAHVLGVQRSTLYRLLRNGELDSVRVGKRRKVNLGPRRLPRTEPGDDGPVNDEAARQGRPDNNSIIALSVPPRVVIELEFEGVDGEAGGGVERGCVPATRLDQEPAATTSARR